MRHHWEFDADDVRRVRELVDRMPARKIGRWRPRRALCGAREPAVGP